MNNQELKQSFAEFQQGNMEAFGRIYEDMKIPVFTVICRIVKDREIAEDVMQDLFLKLFSSPLLPTVKNPRAWIFRMAHNLSVDALRKKSTEDLCETSDCSAPIFTDQIVQRLDIEQAILLLPVQEREILALHINGELPFHQIALTTGLSIPAVYRRYQKALKRLRKQLDGGVL